ncbi:GIY-YIG nuclease family protein [Patescibacteria group bacterium]|nr:GIY-YIG nuclease family protein [Patescibacteria group bacterium]
MERITASGIYQIKNILTGDFYIGSSTSIYWRIYDHLRLLKLNKHYNPILQNVWNKYGEEYFECKPIIICDKKNKVFFEQLLLDGLSPKYNIAKSASAPFLGLRLSEEHKRKIGLGGSKNWGLPSSEERRQKCKERMIGNKLTSGIKLSEEHKRKVSESLIGNTRALGIKKTEEWKQRMSAIKTGKKTYVMTEEIRNNMRLARLTYLGRKLSETTL